ncbi:hypothetical protein BJ138DRAFT_1142208 [Hygrophoropsis aurantiaca]|uniref:Uncharacterized protein n=1 Tax=Hygrophoropsis aurantiaca TaxID=72124 RepID=A0ACB8ANY3_9AGAM|nr:hypothetical protein BJ138DRAFT_1142208 [Hygrophoropsis aurantiaca]
MSTAQAPTPRSSRFDLPPAPTYSSTGTDSGLAEWTSRIKAMQRQVDADEETEQRRLEEEIVRARLARMRRSRTGQSGDFGIGMHGVDLAMLQNDTSSSHQSESSIPSSSTVSEKPLAPNVALPAVPPKSAPVSLAAFMGGSASGPRLRRHEAQADPALAYDGRADRSAVHPIFGRGGVAMPGMVSRNTNTGSAPSSARASLPSPPAQSTEFSATRKRTTSTSSIARRYVENLEEQKQPTSQNQKPVGLGIRERRISTLHGDPPAKSYIPPPSSRPVSQTQTSFNDAYRKDPQITTPSQSSRSEPPIIIETRAKTPVAAEIRPKSPLTTEFGSRSPVTESRPKTPVAEPMRAKTPTRNNFSPPPSGRSRTPNQQPPSSTPTPPVKLPAPSPSPGRPTYSPQPQRGLSPAFLRPPSAPKDPTPSISRLQGRGFVQSVVQASGQRESEAQAPGNAKSIFSSPAQVDTKEKSARRASVLDRWQPGAANNSATPSPPPPSPKGPPLNRSRTVGSPQVTEVTVVKSHDTGRSIRSTVSHSSLAKTPLKKNDPLPPSVDPNDPTLGSSSTMISYIKPTKTGDDPIIPDTEPQTQDSRQNQKSRVEAMAESFGGGSMRASKAGGGGSSPAMPSPGKPLSHPTKERVRKPRKGASNHTGEHAPEQDTDSKPAISPPTPQSIPSGPAHITSPRPQLQPQVTITPPSSTGRITDRWTEPTLIDVKPISSSGENGRALPSPKPQLQGTNSMVGRRALPGLTGPVSVSIPQPPIAEKDEKQLPPPKEERAVPPSPGRHHRIPSTGNRALVMDVAQALSQHQSSDEDIPSPPNLDPASPTVPPPSFDPPVRLRNAPSIPVNAQSDKRKSSYERYSAIVMPPLKEERTPLPTPAGTLTRSVAPEAIQILLGSTDISESPMGSMRAEPPAVKTQPDQEREMVHIDYVDEPLPSVDIGALLQSTSQISTPDIDLRPVSTEVLAVTGTNALPVQRDSNVFYDSEVLTVIHRAKSRETGLVVTKVWCWRGNQCHFGEREEKKVHELARRYGTTLDIVHQYCEPPELVHILGGQLAIRQGSRAHWSSENTAMHIIRSCNGHVVIDEVELAIKNLCSGFSYCISILNNIYVWHGCGSTPKERQAALAYARGFAAKGATMIELVEGENDADDGMFWMILGDGDYAKADYWQWRSRSPVVDPHCWTIDVSRVDEPIRSLTPLSSSTMLQESVYIIDCVWEFFVVVGREARAQRQNIKLAVETVMEMSKRVAASKPFTPTVHVLVFPTQLPLDLRLAFRDLDETKINGSDNPDHMNILSTGEALDHLRTSSWDKAALRDHTMLPLGLDSSHIPS